MRNRARRRQQTAAASVHVISVLRRRSAHVLGGFVVGLVDDLNVSADPSQLAHQVLVAPFDEVDTGDLGGAGGGETGDDHGSASPEVTGTEGGTGQVTDPFDDGDLAVHLDGSAHALELVHITEPVLPDALVDDAGAAVGETEHGGHLRLHIGGEAGIGHGLDVGALDVLVAGDPDGVALLLDLNAHLHQLGGDAVHVLGDDVADEDTAAGGSHGGHISARLDLVGDDGIGAAVEGFHAVDLDDVGAGAHDVGAHRVEEVGHVHDMRFLGGVLDDGQAVGQDAGQDGVDGGAHGDLIHIDGGPGEPLLRGLGINKPALKVDVSAQRFEALQVQVDGTHTQVTATGHGDLRLAKSTQQSADEVIGGAHPPCQFVGDAAAANVTAVNFKCVLIDGTDIGTQLLEDLHDYGDVADLRNIFNTAAAIHQEGGGDDGHSSVLCAADLNFAEQGMSAVNYILLQDDTFFGNE